MSQGSNGKVETKTLDVESLVERIKELTPLYDCVVLVNTGKPTVSGRVKDGDLEYTESLPLGDGLHIVISVGNLPCNLPAGLNEVDIKKKPEPATEKV